MEYIANGAFHLCFLQLNVKYLKLQNGNFAFVNINYLISVFSMDCLLTYEMLVNITEENGYLWWYPQPEMINIQFFSGAYYDVS